ncbi:hypothetical protein PAXINDRAFT_101726 [Paxillus involutus ATCC 200175]|uniref:C2H2-type domain-containing protein n=1 Tax=Paxillus involutus ATCC 200175 TaxID=664439 RepID=A0A0C9TKS3_PAXIN|nr:hypothetical protein PAXINDRAFT_101726 [Paxillus involutus ATCC 200175]
MDFNCSPCPSQYVAAFLQPEFCGPWDPHQTVVASQQESNSDRGPDEMDMMKSLAQRSGYSRMNHPADATMITNGDALPAQAVTAVTGYECAWLVNHSRCGERFDTVPELVCHLGETHGARGAADKLLTCQWDTERGPCLADFQRRNFRRHLRSHLGITNVCEDCGRIYSRVDTLRSHVKKRHPRQ